MDVDNNDIVDQQLLQQFSCMGTSDKDDLIKQLQKLAGDSINASKASFFLEMNNWNLQAAVCSYFDFETPYKLPSMVLMRDELTDSLMDSNETLPPNTMFKKTWRIHNNGEERWPVGCYLQFAAGDLMSSLPRIGVPSLAPTETAEVVVEMKSPSLPGIYQCKWRMITPSGSYFGDIIWVILTVCEDGTTTELTNQLSNFNALGAPSQTDPSHHNNPFSSPSHLHYQDSVNHIQDNDNTMC